MPAPAAIAQHPMLSSGPLSPALSIRPFRAAQPYRVSPRLAATLVLAVASLGASPPLPIQTFGARDGGPSVLLRNADGTSPFTGIGRYLGRASCTAVFVKTFDDDVDPGRAPAYALTNGHCPDFPGANDVLLDRPPGRGQVTFNYFADSTRAQYVVPVARTSYATMKGQDVAVLELSIGYDALRRRGVEPWPISRARPSPNEALAVVGAPLRTDPGSAYLRLAACRLDGLAPTVLEHVWHWFDFWRHACADVAPGSSGSPVIVRRTGQMIGLVNTTTWGGRLPGTECTFDHPCEPVAGGEQARADTTYVTPLMGIDACFDGGWFDVRATGCALDPGEQAVVTPQRLGHVNPRLTTVPIGRVAREWNVNVSGADVYQYKVAFAGVDDCRDRRGYGRVRSVQVEPVIGARLPERDGWWLLCVLAGWTERGGTRWQSTRFPTVVVARVDTVRPLMPPPLTFEEDDQGWRVTFRTLPPEVTTYMIKFGRPADTQCRDPLGYRLALVPFFALPRSGAPYLFCVIPYDQAGNPGLLVERILP